MNSHTASLSACVRVSLGGIIIRWTWELNSMCIFSFDRYYQIALQYDFNFLSHS